MTEHSNIRRSAPGYLTLARQWKEYVVDRTQRSIMTMDIMRKRGNIYRDHREQGKPPVLVFDYEMLLDGREMEKPANYALLRLIPEEGWEIDPEKRPYVIVDPRAGHGPGIGGSKVDSQAGVAMRAGHPVYFITFFAEPEPGQTLLDVAETEAIFIREVSKRHPDAGKPCVIGNCQAGWAVIFLNAMEPDLMGPVIVNGAPLSYWAGEDGKNPMRYSGGLLGGTWLASLAADLGHGRFDGANLVLNFENLNPANTLWTKQFNLFRKVDTEEQRFLDFEKWWGGFFLMNREEMDAIVQNLFVGNRLQNGEIELPNGGSVDMKHIRSPIVVFASHGDNITPPQQALNWIIDLYGHEREIVRHKQTIVYLLHEDIGHLGIFVAGKVAAKEHSELVSSLDTIEALPPGLYEMKLEKRSPTDKPSPDSVGNYDVRFETRTVDDIRKLDDQQQDEDYFHSVDQISQILQNQYDAFLSPWVRAFSSEASSQMLRELHPLRLQRTLISDLNPLMKGVESLAGWCKSNRQPASEDNWFISLENDLSDSIESALNAFQQQRDNLGKSLFKATYGPMGFGSIFPAEWKEPPAPEQPLNDLERGKLMKKARQGGLIEALSRLIILNVMARGVFDRRSFAIANRLRESNPKLRRKSEQQVNEIFNQQFEIITQDRQIAIDTLSDLLPTMKQKREAYDLLVQILMLDPEIDDIEEALKGPILEILGITTNEADDEQKETA